jgi:hypothetical protein
MIEEALRACLIATSVGVSALSWPLLSPLLHQPREKGVLGSSYAISCIPPVPEESSSLAAYLMALGRRDGVMIGWEEFFADWDVLVMPAGTSKAEQHGEESTEPSQDHPLSLSAVSGCPMIVILAGVDSQGLPFGQQILARRWDDERLLDIAESLVGAKR